MPDLSDWLGRTTQARDVAAAGPQRRLRALMDEAAGEMTDVPPLGHWLYFLPDARQAELAPDGHPRPGGDLPDLGLPRRMWAGGRVTFHAPIPIGSPLTRRTVIQAIEDKAGRSGRLAFVTLRHEIAADGTIAITEETDLVYREAAPLPALSAMRVIVPQPLPQNAIVASHRFEAAELFRFSALTFNAHRIHYDRDYACRVDGYPALVVHAPFQAISLMRHLRRHFPQRNVRGFSFRVHGPLFEHEAAVLGIEAAADGAALWLRPGGGPASVTATAEFTA